jgi:hypothetical protein
MEPLSQSFGSPIISSENTIFGYVGSSCELGLIWVYYSFLESFESLDSVFVADLFGANRESCIWKLITNIIFNFQMNNEDLASLMDLEQDPEKNFEILDLLGNSFLFDTNRTRKFRKSLQSSTQADKHIGRHKDCPKRRWDLVAVEGDYDSLRMLERICRAIFCQLL